MDGYTDAISHWHSRIWISNSSLLDYWLTAPLFHIFLHMLKIFIIIIMIIVIMDGYMLGPAKFDSVLRATQKMDENIYVYILFMGVLCTFHTCDCIRKILKL